MSFEELIVYHCAPALAGIKPSNLVSCLQAEAPSLEERLAELRCRLGSSGMNFEILCICKRRILLLVYRNKALSRCLSQREIQAFLRRFGYPQTKEIDKLLKILKKRLETQNEFPHEIGAFLGYPLHDLVGFMHPGEYPCLYSGYWKVYDKVEEAKKTFRQYDICRRVLLEQMMKGIATEEIFCTAPKIYKAATAAL